MEKEFVLQKMETNISDIIKKAKEKEKANRFKLMDQFLMKDNGKMTIRMEKELFIIKINLNIKDI